MIHQLAISIIFYITIRFFYITIIAADEMGVGVGVGEFSAQHSFIVKDEMDGGGWGGGMGLRWRICLTLILR